MEGLFNALSICVGGSALFIGVIVGMRILDDACDREREEHERQFQEMWSRMSHEERMEYLAMAQLKQVRAIRGLFALDFFLDDDDRD